jgi:uncharacterized protein YjbI with pentapeptide repeats
MNRLKSAWQTIRGWKGWRWVLILVVVAALAVGVYYLVAIAIPVGYTNPNTGFGEHTLPTEGIERAKTLWDWMQLLLVPLGLLLATIGFGAIQERNRRLEERTAQELEAERARENALQMFLNDIGQLIRENNLGEEPPKNEEAPTQARRERIRALAQAKTNTILALLKNDDDRRLHAIEFLGRAQLLTRWGILMRKANLSCATLYFTTMQGALLVQANLRDTILWNANLQGAHLIAADLQRADLTDAMLQGAHFRYANLKQAIVDPAQFDETTILPDGTNWSPNISLKRFTDPNHPDFWRSDDPISPAYRGHK